MSEDTAKAESADQSPAKKTTKPRASTKKASAGSAKPAAKKPAARRKPAAAKKTAGATPKKTEKAISPEVDEAKTSDETSKKEAPRQTTEDLTGGTTMSSEHQASQSQTNSSQLMEDLKGRDWPQIVKRAFFMFFFGVLGWVSLSLAFFLAAAQVLFTIFAGEANSNLTRVIKQFANYIHDVLNYLSFATDETPFPFDRKWPDAD